MIHICKKMKCPKRISFGSANDSDHIAFLCNECGELYYYSENRTKSILSLMRLLLIISFVLLGIYFLKSYLNKPNIDSIIDFGIEGDSIAINVPIYPKLKDDTYESFKIDFGNGRDFISDLPDSVSYNKSGVYDIIFESDEIRDKRKFFVFDPAKLRKKKTKNIINSKNQVKEQSLIESDTGNNKSIKPLIQPSINRNKLDMPQEIEQNKETAPNAKNTIDCPNKGKACDDKNENTERDIIRNNCKCEGIPIIQRYYSDIDGDKLGDPDDFSQFPKGNLPNAKWVMNDFDKCPLRKGLNTANGCPVPIIEQKLIEIFQGESFTIKPIIETIANDNFLWKGEDKVRIISGNSKNGKFLASDYGKSSITFNISNPNGYNESVSVKVLSRISKKDLEDKIREDLIIIGQYDPGNNIPRNLRNKSENTRSLLVRLFDRDAKISEAGRAFGNNIGAFIDAKMLTKGSYVNDVRVNRITYNKKGLIDNLDLELKKF